MLFAAADLLDGALLHYLASAAAVVITRADVRTDALVATMDTAAAEQKVRCKN